jgi:hypothetical protein
LYPLRGFDDDGAVGKALQDALHAPYVRHRIGEPELGFLARESLKSSAFRSGRSNPGDDTSSRSKSTFSTAKSG